MKILLVLTAATLLTTALGHATARQVGQPQPVARRPDGLGPDLVRGAVRRVVGFDRLQALLARGR